MKVGVSAGEGVHLLTGRPYPLPGSARRIVAYPASGPRSALYSMTRGFRP